MAFVNKQGGAEKHETGAEAGLVIDFDPDDESIVKVHYDLAGWDFDLRAELAQALAEQEIPHAWVGDELVVPEAVEAAADEVFEVLESEMGPFPAVLGDDAESTEFGLDEWSDADREMLQQAIVDAEIPHRWQGTTLFVARDAEEAVDDLLDAIEAGELMPAEMADAESGPPENALSDIFLSADKLAKDPFDAKSRLALIELSPLLDPKSPPYAMSPRPWAQVVAAVDAVVTRIVADADGDRVAAERDTDDDRLEESSDVIGLAQALRTAVRPYV